MDLIRLRNVNKTYKNGVTAIYDMDLNIKKGEFVFIIGETGCGKSTLIKMLYREEKPNRGKILVGGIDVAKLRNRKVYKLRRKIGVVFQDYQLLPKLTAYENIAFALEVFGLPKDEIHKKVVKVLELVGLTNKAKHYPNQLSGGEQQRVTIARALVNSPDILLLDEPMGALDSFTRADLQDKLLEIQRNSGITMILVTHDVDEAVYLSDRIVIMTPRPGKIAEILDVNLSKKRNRASENFIEYRNRILDRFHLASLEPQPEYYI